jgi:hypothetical protein
VQRPLAETGAILDRLGTLELLDANPIPAGSDMNSNGLARELLTKDVEDRKRASIDVVPDGMWADSRRTPANPRIRR